MRNLKRGLMDQTELTKRGRWLLRSGSFFYFILLCLMCFLPQHPEPGMEAPGIQHFGRIVVLLVPLNSLMNLGQITSVIQLIKVILQNVANVFLLSPLVFQLLWLWPWLRSHKRVLLFGFGLSLWIESSQVLLDLLFDANRVFELDDLWTNTLGAYLAYLGFQYLQARLLAKNGEM
ncbi:MAG: VanZ family protein [Streptococcus sp.]